MKITKINVEQFTISDIKDLDPVHVIMEDIAPSHGKILIQYCDKAWSSEWSAMSGQTIKQFFCTCDNHYLAKNLAPHMHSTVLDEDAVPMHAKNKILSMRKAREFEKEHARDLYNRLSRTIIQDEILMGEIYGEDWWVCLPSKESSHYKVLNSVIDLVRDALLSKSIDHHFVIMDKNNDEILLDFDEHKDRFVWGHLIQTDIDSSIVAGVKEHAILHTEEDAERVRELAIKYVSEYEDVPIKDLSGDIIVAEIKSRPYFELMEEEEREKKISTSY